MKGILKETSKATKRQSKSDNVLLLDVSRETSPRTERHIMSNDESRRAMNNPDVPLTIQDKTKNQNSHKRGRPAGSKNRRTLAREARALGADGLTLDSMAVIEEAAAYFLALAHREKGGKDTKARRARIREHYYDAAVMAEKILPFRHPRLSTIKVSGDRKNPLNGQSREQLMASILADLTRFGVTAEHLQEQKQLPMIDVTPAGEEPSESVANR